MIVKVLLAWYFCLLKVLGFEKVNRSQISSKVDMKKPLLEKAYDCINRNGLQ